MPDEFNSYQLFGAEALRQRLPALNAQLAGVRSAEDIEAVHQMRVATRRLRAAFALFAECLPNKRGEEWQREIKRITQALGAARDTDVQFEWLRKFLAKSTDPAWRPGINRAMLRLHQQRQRLQIKVVEALDRLEASRTLDDLGTLLRDQVVQARLNAVDPYATEVYLRAAEAIRLQLEHFLAYDVYVYQPEHSTELHAMRIAAKHLRYTLEIFAELYKDTLKQPLKVVKEMQELLGDLHDSDVWIDFVPQFMLEERARTADYFGVDTYADRFVPGLQALQADRQRYRQKCYEDFVVAWEHALADDVWNRLRERITVDVVAAPPIEPAASTESPSEPQQ
ncbi:MAG: CHAD domain-containing protein [Thermoflexales bacterium]|nr:CHAD domain-containing protein [Thermoflexales bacterium]